MRTGAWAGVALWFLLAGVAQAALQSRLNGQAVYDTDLDITWFADANLAVSNTFGISGIKANGRMTWYRADEWIAAMNAVSYLGYSDWRLPLSNGPCGDFMCPAIDEMEHLFYSELGGMTGQSITVTHNGNFSLFSNIQSDRYWSGTSLAVPGYALDFRFNDGYQSNYIKGGTSYAWAVRAGDVIPVPGAAWLLGSALALSGLVRRRVL